MKYISSDSRLYGIVDLGYVHPEDVENTTAALLSGGIRILQLRAKGVDTATVEHLARRMQPLCREAGAVFVLNDYPDMAARIGADAVHVGQDAGPLSTVRAIVGEDMLIGRSTHSPEQALAAVAEGADYIGFGPLFPTGTKPGRPSIGLQDIAAVQEKLGDFPMFCIGGINGTTLPSVLQAGARRVVIVSWLLQQPDPAAAARDIISRLADRVRH
ncbi:MAG: thiamine phosphate synthase [Akkermansiaceae bacterium]|nr:thiamine phosphate synthase [Akkermansiaceae bacterium]